MQDQEMINLFMGGAIAMGFAVFLLINVVVCWLLYNALDRIPASFRQMEPAMVWLLLIPCFSWFWNFMVFPKIARSFKAYFDSVQATDVGDCGEKLGLWYSILIVASIIPFLGWFAGVAALVLLILYLIKATELKNRIAPTSP
jgi:hypothetical protein